MFIVEYDQFVLWDDCVGHVESVPGLFLMWFNLDKYLYKLLYFIYILTLGDLFYLLLYIQVMKHNICGFYVF